eukprot:TRINITY_DN416_c0_g2_i3.p1 TRINITY_DN416_c0_g2~~TRINITY_DN416_c0_g2_i3.p1  ORF type:complete len:250 (+),score=12.87 TRINITY_DN416_c0_g2_i3:104-853(+)
MTQSTISVLLILFIVQTGRCLQFQGLQQNSSGVPSSKFTIAQQVWETVATSNAFMTNSGNRISGLNITNIVGQDPTQFGIGLIQVANSNNVTSTGNYSNSGNQIEFQNITESTVISVQDASNNTVVSGPQSEGNSGNMMKTDLVAYSDINLEQVATYNEAYATGGQTNSGNMGLIDTFIGGSANVTQQSNGNSAVTMNGDGNSGNIFQFDNFCYLDVSIHKVIFFVIILQIYRHIRVFFTQFFEQCLKI